MIGINLLLSLQGKAAAASTAVGGLPLTIGRPVVKNAKESAKTTVPPTGGRPRASSGAGTMPIIGRPVVTPAVTPSKLAKMPGLGDSPQAASHIQQSQGQGQGQGAAGQQGQQGQQSTMHIGQSGRIAGSGAPSPGQTLMQVRLVGDGACRCMDNLSCPFIV